MSEVAETQPAATTTETVTPPVTPAATTDNSTIRNMRAELAARDAKLKELEAKVQEQERAKLDELDRLKLEKQDAEAKLKELETAADRATKLEERFKGLYEQELSEVPEEHRERIAKLTSMGTYDERVEALREAKALITIPKLPTSSAPNKAAPGSGPSLAGVNPKDMSWGDVFKAKK